jgi:transglutaminase-like putative cysteine protease
LSRIRLLGTLALVLVCVAGALVAIGLQPAARSASDLAGDHWFRITLNDQQIGYMHSTIDRDWRGRWQFATDLRFVLRPGQPVRIRQQLEFGALPPFPLLHGEQRTERSGAIADAAELVRQGDGYAWRRSAATGAEPRVEPVDWSFGLADYLAFEAWLRATAPAPGSTVTLPSLDFGRRQLVPKRYRILARTADGYEIENPAPHEATRVTLDGRLQPTHMTLAGLFDLERVPKSIALAPRTALQAASYHVPVDRPLADHTRIRRLVLGVEGSLDAARVWPELTDPAGAVLNLGVGTPSGLPRTGEELAATEAHPVDDARIRRLAREAVAAVEGTAAQARALTRFVHGFVRYEADARSRHVLALLDDPAGDCSEYADLLTTLARSLGIPARTVFGLAYADETPPAFRFHAWNELSVDGRWIVVDPTWNQTEVDATHIPMPLDVATALQLLTGGGNLRFVVRDVGY